MEIKKLTRKRGPVSGQAAEYWILFFVSINPHVGASCPG
jgi:hypothetical protein